ncbi:MAG TPA: hypothetical protein VF211_10325 [Burkholderiales bacterium]
MRAPARAAAHREARHHLGAAQVRVAAGDDAADVVLQEDRPVLVELRTKLDLAAREPHVDALVVGRGEHVRGRDEHLALRHRPAGVEHQVAHLPAPVVEIDVDQEADRAVDRDDRLVPQALHAAQHDPS